MTSSWWDTNVRAYLLAADRVYHSCMSPCRTVGFYPTLFTLTLAPLHPIPPNKQSLLHWIVGLLHRKRPARLTQCIYIHLLQASRTFPRTSLLQRCEGGIVSVALSLRLPLVAVSNCHIPMLPGLSSPFCKAAISQ